MSDTTFQSGTLIQSDWLNDVNKNTYRAFVNVQMAPYSAVGDGVTDDTAAIQAALNSSADYIVLPLGTYRITSGLTSSLSDRQIVSFGGVLIGDTNDIAVLTVSGDRSYVSVRIDGNAKARQGVVVTGAGCLVEGCDIQNLYGTTAGADGIRATTNGGVTIRRNRIKTVNALGNATLGDSPGACRAIILNNTADTDAPSVIEQNSIEDITGEEGDAIQVLSFLSGAVTIFLKSNAVIRDNTIVNWNRRGIKIQSSRVRIEGNKLVNTLLSAATPNAVAGMDLIQGDDIDVVGNEIYIANDIAMVGIFGNGDSVNRQARTKITGNKIISACTTATAIFVEYLDDSEICDNELNGGRDGISLTGVNGCMLRGNRFTGSTDTSRSDIWVLSSSSNVTLIGNTAQGGTRANFIKDDSTDTVKVGNVNSRATSYNGITTALPPVYDLTRTGSTAAITLWTPYTFPIGTAAGSRIVGKILIRPTLTTSTCAIRVYVNADLINGVTIPVGTTQATVDFEVVITGASTQRGWIGYTTSTGTGAAAYGTGAESNTGALAINVEVQLGSAAGDTMVFTVSEATVTR